MPHKFAHIKGGDRDDLPGIIIRSREEANICRLLNHLREQGVVLTWDKEQWCDYFPGVGTTGNYTIRLDYFVILTDGFYFWLEVKGSLKEGGALADIDLSTIAAYDDASRIKLERFKRWYKERVKRTYVLGVRELRQLEQQYGWLPHWEPSKPLKKAA